MINTGHADTGWTRKERVPKIFYYYYKHKNIAKSETLQCLMLKLWELQQDARCKSIADEKYFQSQNLSKKFSLDNITNHVLH